MDLEKKLNNALYLNDKSKLKLVFEEIFITYKGLVAFIISSYIESRDDIDDLIYETFLQFFNNASNIQTNIKGYLTTIAKNKTLNFINKQRRSENVDIELLDSLHYQSYKLTDHFSLIVTQMHQHLSYIEINIILDHLIEDMTFNEIADKYSINVNSVKSRYFRALKKCNKAMKGDK